VEVCVLRNKILIVTALFAILIIAAIFITANIPVNSSYVAANYLKELGWVTDENPVETAAISLPAIFDDVYLQYNEIQKKAGFDLSGFAGKKAIRYTFAIKNYGGAQGVRANILVYNGKVIGGDIMTVGIDGFMKPLKKR